MQVNYPNLNLSRGIPSSVKWLDCSWNNGVNENETESGTYVNGVRQGPFTIICPDKVISGNYTNGVKDPRVEITYNQGNIVKESCTMKNGTKDGEYEIVYNTRPRDAMLNSGFVRKCLKFAAVGLGAAVVVVLGIKSYRIVTSVFNMVCDIKAIVRRIDENLYNSRRRS